MATRRKYDLYYTLNTHIPTREFTKDELDTFWVNIGKLNTLQSQAVVLLIYEYSLVEAELIYLPESIVLPYNGKQKKNVRFVRIRTIAIQSQMDIIQIL